MNSYNRCVCVFTMSSSIKVNINPATEEIELTGENEDIICECERAAFNLSDKKLKKAVREYTNAEPTNVYVKSPTPWGDMYKKYDWEQVTRIVKPISWKATTDTKSVVLARKTFKNNFVRVKRCSVGLTQTVDETISHSWTSGHEIGIETEIKYSFGSTGASYKKTWGKGESHSTNVKLGSNSGVEVDLMPGESVTSTLRATKGTMKVVVTYEATLDGYVAINFHDKWKGHALWAIDVNDILEAGGYPKKIKGKEEIEVGFYTDTHCTTA